MQESALFAAVLREVLEHLIELGLFALVDVEQESAELVFKVVHASKVIVAALFVRLEELSAQVTAFEAFVDGLGAEAACAHRSCNAASGKRVRVVGRIAYEGEVVQRVVLEDARNRNDATDDVVDFCTREELVEPFHRDVEDVPFVIVRNQESGAEVRDVGFDFREAPDVAVVNKVVALPEREVVRLGKDALHLDVDACAGESWLLEAVEADLAADATFDAVCGNDHLGADFFGRFAGAIAELDADGAHAFFDGSDVFGAGLCDEFGAIVLSEVGEPRVELFTVEHDARAFLCEVDVHAVRAVYVESVDNRFDAALVDRAVGLQIRKLGACFAATHGVTDSLAFFEEENLVACTGEISGSNTSAGTGANNYDIVFLITEHRSTPEL